MSSEGALIEGAVLPPPGSAVRLLRGSLLVPAVVAWTAEGRCGLRFSSVVSVRDWLAPPANREQQRIDELVRVVKAGAVPFPASNCEAAAQSAELAQDLVRVSQLIERCTDDLAGDETILERHGERLMDLDIALQTMRVVSDILAGDGDQAVAGSRLENLRTSCRQAIRR